MYSDDTTYPSGIAVEDTTEMFAREILVNTFDYGSNTVLPFNQDVTVFLSTTASYVDTLNGDEIGEASGEYCDVRRGLFSSVAEMIGSKPKSDKVLRTVTVKVMKTMFIKAKQESHHLSQPYYDIPNDWFHLDERQLLDDLIVWAALSTEDRFSGDPVVKSVETYEPECIAQFTLLSLVPMDEQIKTVKLAAQAMREAYEFEEEDIFPMFMDDAS